MFVFSSSSSFHFRKENHNDSIHHLKLPAFFFLISLHSLVTPLRSSFLLFHRSLAPGKKKNKIKLKCVSTGNSLKYNREITRKTSVKATLGSLRLYHPLRSIIIFFLFFFNGRTTNQRPVPRFPSNDHRDIKFSVPENRKKKGGKKKILKKENEIVESIILTASSTRAGPLARRRSVSLPEPYDFLAVPGFVLGPMLALKFESFHHFQG